MKKLFAINGSPRRNENTVQFKDYSKYEASMFSEEDKRAYREANWKRLCDKASQIGRCLIE